MQVQTTLNADSVFAALGEIKRGPRRGIMTKAMRLAVKPLPAIVKSGIPREMGLLARYISHKVKFYVRRTTAVGLVGPRADKPVVQRRASSWSPEPQRQNPAKYAHLVERGTKPHVIRRKNGGTINHPGAKAQPFLEPAARSNGPSMVSSYKKYLVEEYQKAWDKAVAKGKTIIQTKGTTYSRAARGYVKD